MAVLRIDQSDPLYIGQSDSSGAVLIPIKLTGSKNYGVWSRSMRIALIGKRKYGFVTGACTKALYKDELHEQWETCNAIVLSWLMNTVSEELLSGIVYATTAFSVWVDLKERFDKVNRMRIYQLHKEITTLTQGTDSVSCYFSKLKTLWSEYDAVTPHPSCSCPQSKEYVDHLGELRLIQFLSGLNESYDQPRRQILLKGITPSLNQAYAMIIEDEIQHSTCTAAAVDKPNSMVMNVRRAHGKEVFTQGKEGFKSKKRDYCHFSGHTRDNCYKLIGYPSDWKFKKKPGYSNKNGGYDDSNTGYGSAGHKNNSDGPNASYRSPHRANNVAGDFNTAYDQSQLASTSQGAGSSAGNDTCLARAQVFTEKEYK